MADINKDRLVRELDETFGGGIKWGSLRVVDLVQLHDLFVGNVPAMITIFLKKLSDSDREKIISEMGGKTKSGGREGGLLFGLPTIDEFMKSRPAFKRLFGSD